MQNATAGAAGGSVATNETDRLIASDKVEGTSVYNRSGERIGEVYNFMVDKRSGRVAYAVMSFGGFLGIGQNYHPLPWQVLTYDTDLSGYVVDLDEETLRARPASPATRLQTGIARSGTVASRTTIACRSTRAAYRARG